MKNKILSVLLCIAMLLSCLSAYTYAAVIEVEIDLGGLFDDEPTDSENPEDGTTPPEEDEEEEDATDDKETDSNKNNNKNNNKGNGTGSTSSKDDKKEETPAIYENVNLVLVADSLYKGIDEENMPMVMSAELTEENFEAFAFVPYDEAYEAVVSEPMIGSIAHSVVLVKCESADAAEKLAEEMKKNCNPRKWICVEADVVETAVNNNIAMLLMTTEDGGLSETILSNFASLDAEKIAALKPSEEETPAEWENPFTDVKNTDWFYDTVKYVNQNGIINGMTEDTFAPSTQLTRAMLVTILYRVEGSPEVESESKFSDVKNSDWYGAPVIWAAENGIVNGVSETEFAPNNAITREQIAAIMYRYAKAKGYDVSVGENTNILSYDDVETISEWAIEAIQYTVGSGIMKGKTETTINPQDKATRAEAATVVMRFIEGNK